MKMKQKQIRKDRKIRHSIYLSLHDCISFANFQYNEEEEKERERARKRKRLDALEAQWLVSIEQCLLTYNYLIIIIVNNQWGRKHFERQSFFQESESMN